MKSLKLCFLAVVILSTPALSQSFEGVINYKINYLEVPPQAKGMESMLPQQVVFVLKGTKLAMKQDMMGGSQTIIYDAVSMESTVLVNMMGQKIAMTMTKEEEEKAKGNVGEPEVKLLEGSKQIAGYNCKKASVTSAGNTMEIWYTKDIAGVRHKDFKSLDGFPLEYTTVAQGMKMQITAQDVTEATQDAAQFEVPDGYRRMSFEEFTRQMGGGR